MLLPSTLPLTTLYQDGKLPPSALFDSTVPSVTDPTLQGLLNVPSANPVFAAGFGTPYLINNSYRLAYAMDAYADPDGAALLGTAALAASEPMQPLRRAFYLNDMRYGSWAPSTPTLMCGGDQDWPRPSAEGRPRSARYHTTAVSSRPRAGLPPRWC